MGRFTSQPDNGIAPLPAVTAWRYFGRRHRRHTDLDMQVLFVLKYSLKKIVTKVIEISICHPVDHIFCYIRKKKMKVFLNLWS